MLSLLLAAALEFTVQDARLSFDRAEELVENCTPRDVGTSRSRDAANRILAAVREAGADARIDAFRAKTPVGEREFANVCAEFRVADTNARWVVVLSHYDTKLGSGCPGANDGAATSGLLIGLAKAYSKWRQPTGNLMLIWTDGEECMFAYGPRDGFWGSKRAAEWLARQRRDVRAVICVDMLGDRDLAIMVPANGSRPLGALAVAAAKKVGCPGLVRQIPELVKDDHVAFLDLGFEAIDLIDFSYGPCNSYWHTPQDTMDKVSVESLFKSGKIVTEMINNLL